MNTGPCLPGTPGLSPASPIVNPGLFTRLLWQWTLHCAESIQFRLYSVMCRVISTSFIPGKFSFVYTRLCAESIQLRLYPVNSVSFILGFLKLHGQRQFNMISWTLNVKRTSEHALFHECSTEKINHLSRHTPFGKLNFVPYFPCLWIYIT